MINNRNMIIIACPLIAAGIAVLAYNANNRASTSCLNKLKSLTHGVLMYSVDNNGLIPQYAHITSRNINNDKFFSENRQAWKECVLPYTSKDMFICPDEKTQYTITNYSYSSFIGPDMFGTNKGFIYMNLNIIDQTQWLTRQGGKSRAMFLTEDVSENMAGNRVTNHGTHGSVSYFDGSVQWVKN